MSYFYFVHVADRIHPEYINSILVYNIPPITKLALKRRVQRPRSLMPVFQASATLEGVILYEAQITGRQVGNDVRDYIIGGLVIGLQLVKLDSNLCLSYLKKSELSGNKTSDGIGHVAPRCKHYLGVAHPC